MKRALVSVCLLLVAAPALAADVPTVAVLPFRDLAHAKGEIGEAIRETVTTDLRGVPGLRVIERSSIDRLLGELKLQEKRADLDPTSTVKLGKLLGASLIALGAYQEQGASARLTARFVKVETGEIVGGAKVDGPARDLLSLEDRVSAELLKSMGMAPPVVAKVTARKRRPLKSVHTVVLYGRAVTEPDGDKKKQLLQMVLSEDPDFVYAAKDLDELEQRLKGYDVASRDATLRTVDEIKARLQTEKDPARFSQQVIQMLNLLQSSRRWHRVRTEVEALAARTDLPPATPPYPELHELAQFYLFTADNVLHDYDATLREGEKFVATYPASPYMVTVRAMMNMVIDEKRKEGEEGAKDAADEIARLDEKWRKDPCRLAGIYQRNHQWKDARRVLSTMAPGQCKPLEYELVWHQVEAGQGHFTEAREWLERLKDKEPNFYKTYHGAFESYAPVD